MDAGARMVDNFVLPNFGPGTNQKPIVSGHPEIEMALIELYRTTGKKQYADLAGYILHGDDRWKIEPQRIVYMFCGIPFTSRTKLEGHAVRAMYACCGATDYYLETGDPAYWKTLNTLWEDLSKRQMYVTGGVGARAQGEAFGEPYELPNAQAYGESCAAIGNMMWNWRMLAASGEARFADVVERALYNGINSGMSLDGTTYCYRNPLAFDPAGFEGFRGSPNIRNPWYDVTCCPPNIERTLSSLPGYFYSTSKDGVYVHLYDNSLLDGASAAVNGKAQIGVKAGEYLALRRTWTSGDTVKLGLPMSTEVIAANPRVAENRSRVAVRRGPIIYCMEELDQPKGIALADVSLDLSPRLGKDFEHDYKADLLDGVVVLRHRGAVFESSSSDQALYGPVNLATPRTRAETVTLIPYYVWANRQPCAMEVWVPYLRT